MNHTKDRYGSSLLPISPLCRQCAEQADFPAHRHNDFAGMITRDQFRAGMTANVTCSICGPTIVDDRGNCVNNDCEKGHSRL